MTTTNDQTLELALADTVNSELKVMQYFCQTDLHCDVSTTIAMRMSRSVVNSICRLRKSTRPDGQLTLSADTINHFKDAEAQLEQLSQQYEERLEQLPKDDINHQVWTA